MMRVSVTTNTTNLTDDYLKQVVQLGVDCLDYGNFSMFPGVKEHGYPDLDELLKHMRRVRSFGLDINRVTLPTISHKFMNGEEGSEVELQNTMNALKVFGEAKIPIARQRLMGDVFPQVSHRYKVNMRGGYISRAESLGWNREPFTTPSYEESQAWWGRFVDVYKELVPIAEDYNVQLAMHPSDTPHPNTPFGGLGLHHIIDAFPNKNVGFVYCVGTRAQAGGSSLVMDEINHYGRKNRIFLVHLRNVRGSLPTAGGFEEALLDDGDLNMFKIMLELKKVGYNGCINPDHFPLLEGDTTETFSLEYTKCGTSMAYAIGYVRALLAALVEF